MNARSAGGNASTSARRSSRVAAEDSDSFMATYVGYRVFPPSPEEYTPVHSRVKPSTGIQRHRPVAPAFHARGIASLIEPDERLLLTPTHGGLPWVAKLDIASFFDAIPHGPLLAGLRGQVASRRCEREVAGSLAWYWQARWPDWPAASPLPGKPVGVPQGSPISGVLANVFRSAVDRALERAGIVFLRYLDDVTILAVSPAALATGLGTAMELLESLGTSLMPEKTQVAWLGGGTPPRAAGGRRDRLSGDSLPGPAAVSGAGDHRQPAAPQDPHGDRGGPRQATGEAAVFPGLSPDQRALRLRAPQPARPLPDRKGPLRAAPPARDARPLRADPRTDAAGGPHRAEVAQP
jgi:hypothetical protein